MKILVCATEYSPLIGGIGWSIRYVVDELKNKGTKTTVRSPDGPDITLDSSLMIEKYGRAGLLYFWYKVSKHFSENAVEYGLAWLHNPLFVGDDPFKQSPTTIHITACGQVIQRLYPQPLYFYKSVSSKIARYCLNKIKKSTGFTAVSLQVKNGLTSLGVDSEKIVYIPHGADLERFKPVNGKKFLRKRFDIPEDGIVVLSVGRLVDVKQPCELVEMFSPTENSTPNISLIIAGMGKLLDKTKTLAREKSIKGIKFLGHVDHIKELPELYACADVYTLTSKYEGGQPLTLLEAMASGLPALVTNIPNPSSIVRGANCGIIINPENKEKSVQQTIGYLESNKLLEDSKNAREYVVNNFDWKLIAETYLNLLNDIKSRGDRVLQWMY
jgi:glycosyltransferase involved in cell wall biosynthesis